MADSRGNNLARAQIPVSSRVMVAPYSTVGATSTENLPSVSANQIKNLSWYPKEANGWLDLGLTKVDGGHKWTIQNVAPPQNFVSRQAAMQNGDVNVTLDLVVGEYSAVIFKLHTGKAYGTNDFASISRPHKAMRWLVFSEEKFKSGKVRRRVGIATASMDEEQLVRGEVLGFRVVFNFVPVAITAPESTNPSVTGNVKDKEPEIKWPGSGLPGLDDIPTEVPPGSDSGKDGVFEYEVFPDDPTGGGGDDDDDKDDWKEPTVPEDFTIDPNGPTPYLGPAFRSQGNQAFENQLKIAFGRVYFTPIYVSKAMAFEAIRLTSFTNPAGLTDPHRLAFALYSSTDTGLPGNRLQSLGSMLWSPGDTTKDRENSLDPFALDPGIYWVGVKRVDESTEEFSVVSGTGTRWPVILGLGINSTGTAPTHTSGFWVDTNNSNVTLPASATDIPSRRYSSFGLQPILSLKVRENL